MQNRLVKYIGKKIIYFALLIFSVSIVTFIFVQASPIDPIKYTLGQAVYGSLSHEQLEMVKEYWGVNTPPIHRFLNWFVNFIHGNMGVSLLYKQDVITIIQERFLNSLPVMLTAWFLSGILGFLLGSLAGMKEGKFADRIVKAYSVVITATPSFWLGLLMIMIFSVSLGIFPIGFSGPIGVENQYVSFGERVYHSILPIITLTIVSIGPVALHTREKMIEVKKKDYFEFAKCRGERGFYLYKNHGFRNIILPALTLQFASIGEIVGGTIVLEKVFSYPGIGEAAIRAGLSGDLALLMGITLLCSTIVFLGNFISDIISFIVDPRMRKEGDKYEV